MSRPEHPGVPLPASCIRDLRQRQEHYDADPERYERQEREREEERIQEEQELQARRREYDEERIQERVTTDLPF
jgi:hypothetical protein